jgi:hypothetical protein
VGVPAEEVVGLALVVGDASLEALPLPLPPLKAVGDAAPLAEGEWQGAAGVGVRRDEAVGHRAMVPVGDSDPLEAPLAERGGEGVASGEAVAGAKVGVGAVGVSVGAPDALAAPLADTLERGVAVGGAVGAGVGVGAAGVGVPSTGEGEGEALARGVGVPAGEEEKETSGEGEAGAGDAVGAPEALPPPARVAEGQGEAEGEGGGEREA